MGPDVEVQLYDACIVNGIQYHTRSRDARRTTQNSGVVQKVQHREIYEVTEVDEVSEDIEFRNNFNIETNQDNSSNEATLVVGEELEISQLCRLDVEHQHINMSNAQVELARDAQSFLNDEDEDTEIDGDTDDQLSLSDDSAMPPKRIEHLPVLETPIDDSSSSGRPLRRETRGTHSDRLRRQNSDRGRLPITFRQSDGHPIGPNAASFMTELGLSVKKFAPLQAKSWKHIPAENKRMIYDRISAAFDISFQEGSSSVMKETDRLMSARYRDNISKMHNHYKKLSHLPPAERRQHIPIEFCETQDDWNYMCDLFESEAFQVNVNPLSKSMNELSISGSKCLDVFYTHCLSCPSQEEHHGGSAVENRSSACLVLGTRSGYIRGLGSGPKLVRSTSSDATSSSRSTNAVLRERLQSTQDELANTKIQLANTQDDNRRWIHPLYSAYCAIEVTTSQPSYVTYRGVSVIIDPSSTTTTVSNPQLWLASLLPQLAICYIAHVCGSDSSCSTILVTSPTADREHRASHLPVAIHRH
ncbi:hypothetical protein ZIOFF_003703 [Zingiber officinale]|uniref:Uncharacterized protein n=1 Tax=Zingiber officinale TaxID=94328 RepID=A0A8J5IPR9_ZINOF|nr:hypothetical protein ZIOFF_003703 [Zingiber officinale]